MATEGAKPMELTRESSTIKEYRIVLPMTVDEYHIGQLYGVAEASKKETGGGDGIEIIENRPIHENEAYFNKEKPGQYTHKRFHLSSKVPAFIRVLAPSNSLEVDEKAWNCFPYCRTEYSNRYMKDYFHIIIETRHEPGKGDIENVHNLDPKELGKRSVDRIDIANDKVDTRDYKLEEDPTKYRSEKTERGPLGGNWQNCVEPVMCCYKLYRVLFKWRGFQNKVEGTIMSSVRRLLLNFHRQVFCWLDTWIEMTIEDIRKLEEATKGELEEMRKNGPVKGMTEK